jgi:hypothetical protein
MVRELEMRSYISCIGIKSQRQQAISTNNGIRSFIITPHLMTSIYVKPYLLTSRVEVMSVSTGKF